MNRMTTYRHLKKLGVTKDTVVPFALEVAFDPLKAYKVAATWFEVRSVLSSSGIETVTELKSVLEGLK